MGLIEYANGWLRVGQRSGCNVNVWWRVEDVAERDGAVTIDYAGEGKTWREGVLA